MTKEVNQKQIENKEIKDSFLKKNFIILIFYSFLLALIIVVYIFCYYMFTLINTNYDQIETFQKKNFETNFDIVNREFKKIDNTFNFINQKFEDIEKQIYSISDNISLINENQIALEKNNNLNDFKKVNEEIIESIDKIKNEFSNFKESYAKSLLDLKVDNNIESNEVEKIKPIKNNPNEENKAGISNVPSKLSLLERKILQGEDEFLIFKIIDELDNYELNDLKEEVSFLRNISYSEIKNLESLKDEFKIISNLMFDKIPSSNDGLVNNIFIWASRSLHLRPINVGDPETPQEKISKIESALKNNDLKQALSVFSNLPNEMQAVAKPWYFQAKTRLNFDNAILEIISYLKDQN